ncbi:MAG: FAD binding domain-containing protein [Pseudomonadota bacterium]
MPYHAPASVDEAIIALASPGAKILAGGTDFYPSLGDRPINFPIVDVTRISALKTIAADHDGAVRIGAGATWSDVVAAPLPHVFQTLKEAARTVGSIQIQNNGTLAGNLCNASPAADGVPALLSLGAMVEISGPEGVRVLPLEEFITGVRATALGPAQMVTAIIVPSLPAAAASAFEKLGARRYLVISIAMVSAVIVPRAGIVESARVAVGSCSAVATRLPALEDALTGAPLSEAGAVPSPAHIAPLSPIDDVRAPAEYRDAAALELVRRAVARAATAASTQAGTGTAL